MNNHEPITQSETTLRDLQTAAGFVSVEGEAFRSPGSGEQRSRSLLPVPPGSAEPDQDGSLIITNQIMQDDLNTILAKQQHEEVRKMYADVGSVKLRHPVTFMVGRDLAAELGIDAGVLYTLDEKRLVRVSA